MKNLNQFRPLIWSLLPNLFTSFILHLAVELRFGVGEKMAVSICPVSPPTPPPMQFMAISQEYIQRMAFYGIIVPTLYWKDGILPSITLCSLS